LGKRVTASIAIVGWGSLIWDSGPLEFDRTIGWRPGGPQLNIEFSRKSKDGRMTLVIDDRDGAPVTTRYAASTSSSLDSAIHNLAERESAPGAEAIGFLTLGSTNSVSRSDASYTTIETWCAANGFTSAVWTDLPPMSGYTLRGAICYLEGLSGTALFRAREYFVRAPPEVKTPLRDAMIRRGWS
jgi:hypothetical protein